MVPQRIAREILIEAPVEVVWAVVTEPRHISGWFSDSIELDLRPGGEAALHWDGHGTVRGRVERVEAPHFFSFRWVIGQTGQEVTDGNSTLVEFVLGAEGESTRLTVVESGFRDLVGPENENQREYEDHEQGWSAGRRGEPLEVWTSIRRNERIPAPSGRSRTRRFQS